MTREKFITYLEAYGYAYNLEGDKIIINNYNKDFKGFGLVTLKRIPDNIIFKNEGDVTFFELEEFSKGLEFRNKGDVFANKIVSILTPVVFKNDGDISLRSVEKISPSVKFENGYGYGGYGDVYFKNLINMSIQSGEKSIDRGRVLNLAIKQGAFM